MWGVPYLGIANLLESEFSQAARSQGRQIFRFGQVRVKQGSNSVFKTVVTGDLAHQEITIEDGAISLWCDCTYYETDGPCRHLYAALLSADNQGYLENFWTQPGVQRLLDSPDGFALLPWEPDVVRTIKVEAKKRPAWSQQLSQIEESVRRQPPAEASVWPAERQLFYCISTSDTLEKGSPVLRVLSREPKKKGGWTKPRELRIKPGQVSTLPDPTDRQILAALLGARAADTYYLYDYGYGYGGVQARFVLPQTLAQYVLPLAAGTGRLRILAPGPDNSMELPLAWDAGEPWQFRINIQHAGNSQWSLRGVLFRGEEEMDVSVPLILTSDGFVFTREKVALLDTKTPFVWIQQFRRIRELQVPAREQDEMLGALAQAAAPLVRIPPEMEVKEVVVRPTPCLVIGGSPGRPDPQQRLRAELSFSYEGFRVQAISSGRGLFDREGRRYIRRDTEFESAARTRLGGLGLRAVPSDAGSAAWELDANKLPHVVRKLTEEGWYIEAHGLKVRRPGHFQLEVTSGIDWFDLHGELDYGETSVRLPAVLEAMRRGETMVRLDDGTYGLLPEEWLARFAPLASLGDRQAEHIRFRATQAGLLDALLATQPEVRVDEAFERVRGQLRQFEGVRAADQPEGFVGTLRHYQQEGLGWMHFLRQFGLGGCLADDMGVGKTAQVLAMLETRRQVRAAQDGRAGLEDTRDAPCGPSLVVVPKSLLFNWRQEAARFTPGLRVTDYIGPARSVDSFADCDLVLTTYGTMRRDALRLKDVEFDYVILDEAQAIKNAETDSAKAARLLRGRHRLALSGTPVENHLGELWSLFEFLNPGMMGAASVFNSQEGLCNPSEGTRRLLAQGLRPFILRRTKQQVAPELPPKTEQTIYCEMDAAQQKVYEELRTYYRASLLNQVEQVGLARSKIQVLEALLRLRQAACHPGLLDQKHAEVASGKLEVLLESLNEVLEEGHKALVFSQFTSFLAILRRHLDKERVLYEYLDGATRDRQAPVERFQNDDTRRLFLISLKAGGLGLNLTAAEYVFLLDPWWNPAVETQAIDRTHRIGQDRPVFAYRLITRGTVEEKVLELQSTKRELAAAIISEDNSLIRDLKREDLELLLS